MLQIMMFEINYMGLFKKHDKENIENLLILVKFEFDMKSIKINMIFKWIPLYIFLHPAEPESWIICAP